MRTRRQTIDDLIEASDFKDSEIVLNIDFIRDLINDAVGQLKDVTKIIADNKRHRTHIKQLKTANAELLTNVKQLESKCRQLERERDAAVADLNEALDPIRGDCAYCAYVPGDTIPQSCFDCANKGYYRWEFRGVKEADHADET